MTARSAMKDDRTGIALCVLVAAGLVTALLDPSTVAGVVTLRGGLAPPTAGLAGWAVALCLLLVGTLMWWWGPVRVPRAAALWQLSGTGDRSALLRAGRNRSMLLVGISCVTVSLLISVLDVESLPVVAGVGVLCAAVVIIVAALHQQRDSIAAWTGSPRTSIRLWAPEKLHRDVIAPDDGLAGALQLAVVTMNLDWITGARLIRWQRTNITRPSRRWPERRSLALIVADFARLSRRRGDLAWWVTLVVIGCAVPLTLAMPVWEPLVAALLAYRAGCVVAAGLRQVTSEPALRRALGGSTRLLYACHAPIPIAGVMVWAAITGAAWDMPPIALVVVAVGAATAAIRRCTRPELPFDAPIYVTNQGGVVQPLLVLAMLRGPAAAVITGLVATLVG